MNHLAEGMSELQRDKLERLHQKAIDLHQKGEYEKVDDIWNQLDNLFHIYVKMNECKVFINDEKEQMTKEELNEVESLYNRIVTVEKEDDYDEVDSLCMQMDYIIRLYNKMYRMEERIEDLKKTIPQKDIEKVETLYNQVEQFKKQRDYEVANLLCDKLDKQVSRYYELYKFKDQINSLTREDGQKAKVLFKNMILLDKQEKYEEVEHIKYLLKSISQTQQHTIRFKRDMHNLKGLMNQSHIDKVTKLYDQAVELKDQSEYIEINKIWNEINTIFRLYYVAVHIEETMTDLKDIVTEEEFAKIEKLYNQGMKLCKEDQYDEAMSLWNQAEDLIQPYDGCYSFKRHIQEVKETRSEEEINRIETLYKQFIDKQKGGKKEEAESIENQLEELICLYICANEFEEFKNNFITIEDINEGQTLYNQAVVLNKEGKYEESNKALKQLQEIYDKYYAISYFQYRIEEIKTEMPKKDLEKVNTLYNQAVTLTKEDKKEEAKIIWNQLSKVLDSYLDIYSIIRNFEDEISYLKETMTEEDLNKAKELYKQAVIFEQEDKYEEANRIWNQYDRILKQYE
jgi:TolA-binding protein